MNKEHPLCRCEVLFSSVQFSHSLMSGSLWPPWTTACQASLFITNFQSSPNPRPLSRWCHLTISSSVVPFSSCLQSFPASGSFEMSQLFASGGQNIGVSASISVLPNEHPGLISFRMGCLDLLAVQGTLKSLLQHPQVKSINSSALSFLYSPVLTSIHDYWKNLRYIGFPFSVLRNHWPLFHLSSIFV